MGLSREVRLVVKRRYFIYQTDLEPTAIYVVKTLLKERGLIPQNIEVVERREIDNLPDDWFDDFNFIIKADFVTALSDDELDLLCNNTGCFYKNYEE